MVSVTHSKPGWTAKEFLVVGKSENEAGQVQVSLRAYYSGIYDDSEVAEQPNYESDLPNPHDTPTSNSAVSLSLAAPGTGHDYEAVTVSVTTPTTDPFYSHSEIYLSNDDATYILAGTTSGEDFTYNGMGALYVPGDTVYVKTVNVNEAGVRSDMPGAAEDSIVITSSIRLGSFYAGLYDFWGGNAAIGNAATTIVLGNLDGTPKIALGPTADSITVGGTETGFIADGDGNFRAGGSTHGVKFDQASGVFYVDPKLRVGTGGTYIEIDGDNTRIRSSNYVAGDAGAGFSIDSDNAEFGNIAARGIIRTAVFQKDVISVVGGYLLVRPGDVLATDMTAADASTLTIEGNETFAVNDMLQIKDGTDNECMTVTNIASAPTYTVTRDIDGDYGADANPAWKTGATVVNHGPSGEPCI